MTLEQLARRRAQRIYPNNMALISVYCKGARAARASVAVDRCPYRAGAGYRNAFRNAWLRGWQSEQDPDF